VSKKPMVLVVDDDAAMRDLLQMELQGAGYGSELVGSGDAALSVLEREPIDVVVTDLRMPGRSGTELCREIVQDHPSIPVIVMTGFGSMEAAIEAIRAGAYDFLTKPFPFETLQITLERALESAAMRSELHELRGAGRELPGLYELIGASPPMERVFRLIERIGPTEAGALVVGESGTGKELAARALHEVSRRRAGPFVSVNCAAIPESLFESELFGYVKGAFTGAGRERAGLLRQADGGTLFLDEIGELPASLQPKLLRVLQEGRVRPVGSDVEQPISVRVLCATNRDLAREVSEGRFRSDLFYRLAVVTIRLPPLRERGDDIVLLAEHFLDELSDAMQQPRPNLGEDAVAALLANPWPGNVRELRNWLEYAMAMSDGPRIGAEQLPEAPGSIPGAAHAEEEPEAALESLDVVECRHIRRVLDAVEGNKTRASKILGIDRKTLLARLHRCDRAST